MSEKNEREPCMSQTGVKYSTAMESRASPRKASRPAARAAANTKRRYTSGVPGSTENLPIPFLFRSGGPLSMRRRETFRPSPARGEHSPPDFPLFKHVRRRSLSHRSDIPEAGERFWTLDAMSQSPRQPPTPNHRNQPTVYVTVVSVDKTETGAGDLYY